VGGLARIVWEIERLHQTAGSSCEVWDGKYTWDNVDRLARRELVMANAPGFSEFQMHLNAELGMPISSEALNEVERRLARRLRKSFDDVRRLSLVEAVAILNRPEAPTAPSSAIVPTNESERQPEAPALSAENKALAVALSMIQRGETPTVSAVAKAAGVSRTYLHECERFMAFINANRGKKAVCPEAGRTGRPATSKPIATMMSDPTPDTFA
jgi:hypothetical protein